MSDVWFSLSDDSNEDEYDEHTTKKPLPLWLGQIKICLDSIKAVGDFAVSDRYTSFPNPGLHVGKDGCNPLSPSARDAETLKKACLSSQPAVASLFERTIGLQVRGRLPALPQKPQGWARAARKCGEASCVDCRRLCLFLDSEIEKEWRFKAGLGKRNHIQNKGLQGSSFRMSEENTKPRTLVVAKDSNDFALETKLYNTARQSIRNEVQPLRRDVVKALLGEDKYREVFLIGYPAPDSPQPAAAEESKKRASEDVGGAAKRIWQEPM